MADNLVNIVHRILTGIVVAAGIVGVIAFCGGAPASAHAALPEGNGWGYQLRSDGNGWG